MSTNTEERISSLIKITEYEKKCAYVSEHKLSNNRKPTLSPFPTKRESTVKIGTTLNKRANTNIIKTEKEKSNGISPTASFISY